MDFKNRSIPVEQVTSFDVNKAIQRSLTKAVARHGLGLYIYAGEDLPDEGEQQEVPSQPSKAVVARRTAKSNSPKPAAYEPMPQETYWKIVAAYAQGKQTKTGGDYRDTWIKTTHAGQEQIEKFDHDVENWKLANMPSDAFGNGHFVEL